MKLSDRINKFIEKQEKPKEEKLTSWQKREQHKRKRMQSPIDISRKRFFPSKRK